MQSLQSRHQSRYVPIEDEAEHFIEERHSANAWNDSNAAQERTIFSGQPDIHESFQANGSRTPIRRSEIGLLRKGDHIGWSRPYLIWHHAIVVKTDVRNRRLKVIHFTKVGKNIKVEEQWINTDEEKGDLFRFDYSEEVINQNPPDLVIHRARLRKGETGYKLFRKNCEHIAVFCKTGREESAQVRWAWGKVKQTLVEGAGNVAKSGIKVGCVVAKEAGKQTYKSVAESAGKIAAAETIEHVGRATNWVGAAFVAGFETVHCAYNVYHIHKNYKAGRMQKRDFRVTTTQRVSEGVVGGGLAIGGGLFGEWIGGLVGGAIGSVIPVVGTAIGAGIGAFVGSVVGGAIGSICGKICGSIFGRWLGKKLW